jgi:hypothetical protein
MSSINPQNQNLNLRSEQTEQRPAYQAIAVTNLQPGSGSVIARCDLKLGGIFVRNVTLRRGRNNSTFLNFPSYRNKEGKWIHLVELVSPALTDFVTTAIHRAISEALP